MIVVYFGWSCVYSFYNTYILGNIYAPTKFKTFFDGCFSGELHMWYIPMIIGLYLISPILAQMLKRLDEKWLKFWIIGLFIFSSVIPFLISLNIKFLSTIINSFVEYMQLDFLKGWTLYFILGYYVYRHSFSKREKRIIYIMAIIAFIFTVLGTNLYSFINGETMGILSYEYPNIILFSFGIILWFKEMGATWKFNARIKDIIIKISGHTFGIYLIHVLVIKILYAIGINIQICHTIISVPLIAIITFGISEILIIIIKRIPVAGKYLV